MKTRKKHQAQGARRGRTALLCGVALTVFAMVGTVPVMLETVASPAAAQSAESDATDLLFAGVQTGDLTTVRESLLLGANMQAKNADGRTAADLAVDLGNFQIAQFLLSVKSYADANTDQTLADAIKAIVGGRTATSGRQSTDVSEVLAGTGTTQPATSGADTSA